MTGTAGLFEGHSPRECGEHRTVGAHRAWCFGCTEWCYPDPELACKGCRLPLLEAELAQRGASGCQVAAPFSGLPCVFGPGHAGTHRNRRGWGWYASDDCAEVPPDLAEGERDVPGEA